MTLLKHRFKHSFVTLSSITIAITLAACGGSIGVSTSPGPGGQASINGTGIARGPVTRFGSVFVNGQKFETEKAEFSIRGGNGTQEDLQVGNIVTIMATFKDDGTATAQRVIYSPELKAPIQSIDCASNTLTVAGQTVRLSGSTVYDDVASCAALTAGDVVEISGNIDQTGVLHASSLEKKTNTGGATTEAELKGTITNLDTTNNTFTINGLTVSYTGATLDPPGLTLQNGLFVEVAGSLQNGQLSAAKVEQEDRKVGSNAEGERVEIQAFIESASGNRFTLVTGNQVQFSSNTRFENGTQANLVAGAEVEVEGTMDANSVLQATKIEFEHHSGDDGHDADGIKVKAPVMNVNTADNTLTVLGMTVQANDSTLFKDGRDGIRDGFGLDSLQIGDYVEIDAFDNGTSLIVLKIERLQTDNKVQLQSSIDSVDQAGNRMIIRGISVNYSGATVFEDRDGNPITQATFFSTVTPATVVEVEGAFDGANTIAASKIEVES